MKERIDKVVEERSRLQEEKEVPSLKEEGEKKRLT